MGRYDGKRRLLRQVELIRGSPCRFYLELRLLRSLRVVRSIGRIWHEIIRDITVAAKDHGIIPFAELRIPGFAESDGASFRDGHSGSGPFGLGSAAHIDRRLSEEIAISVARERQHCEIGDPGHDRNRLPVYSGQMLTCSPAAPR